MNSLKDTTIMTLDSLVIKHREKLYQRRETFIKQIKRHIKKKCNCKKNGKICNYDTPLLSCFPEAYKISNEVGDKLIIKNGIFETVYNTTISISQSLKSNGGKNFEKALWQLLHTRD